MAVTRSRRIRAARKRKRRMDRIEHDLSPVQWVALQEAWGGCAYCRASDRSLQRDCVLPISRGGRYTLDNVVPACRSCNASKCNAEVTAWLRRRRLDERGFLLLHHEIQTKLGLPGRGGGIAASGDAAELHIRGSVQDVRSLDQTRRRGAQRSI